MTLRRIVCSTTLAVFAMAPSLRGTAEKPNPPIVHLAFRNYLVTIHAGAETPLYTVRTTEGTVVGSQLSEQQLAARYPEVHEQIEPAIAAPNADSFLWIGPNPGR